MSSKIHIYDFDGTLFASPFPPDWWKGGWWGKLESLTSPCVPNEPGEEWWNRDVVESAHESIQDEDVVAVLMTARIEKFRERVEGLLSQVGLDFENVYLKDGGGSSEHYKASQLITLINQNPEAEEVHMWEDRAEHMMTFRKVVESQGISFVGHFVDRVSNNAMCSPEDFMEYAFKCNPLLTEDFVGSNFPYRYGKAPGFGFGTGGVQYVKPNRGGQGGQPYKDSVKPYADEFSDHLSSERDESWNAAVKRFTDSVDRMKRDLRSAGTEGKISAILVDLSGGNYDISEDIVADHGVYMSLLRSGDIQKAKNMLMQGIDLWSKSIIAKYQNLDRDYGGLENLVYTPGAWQKNGTGKASWS